MKKILGDFMHQESFGTNKDIEIDFLKVEKLVSFGYPQDYVIQ
jgi:hypothetical protein